MLKSLWASAASACGGDKKTWSATVTKPPVASHEPRRVYLRHVDVGRIRLCRGLLLVKETHGDSRCSVYTFAFFRV